VIVSLLGDSFISFVDFSVFVRLCVRACVFFGPFGCSSRLKERGDTFLREHILGCWWWRCCCVVCLLLVPGNFCLVGFGGCFLSSLSLRVAVLVPVCVSDLGRVPFPVSCLCVVLVAV
jgi:hypothetical protein